MRGVVTRSVAWTKPVAKRPFTHSMPRLDLLAGTSSAMTARRPESVTRDSMPQPTPQYGQVVSTRRVIGAGASFGRSAPVGQVATHWPQEVHTLVAIAPSAKTPTLLA